MASAGQRFARQPRGENVAKVALGKAIHLSWAVGIPLMYHRWWVC